MKPKWQASGFLAAAILWTGCTTAQMQLTREMRTQIEPHDAVAIVAPREAEGSEDISFATAALNCISTALRDTYPALKIVSADQFYRTAFPDLTAEQTPHATNYRSLLAEDPKFRERISRLGLRYLISVEGRTYQKAEPIIGLIGGPGGGATVLGVGWDRKSNLTASILDIKQSLGAGEVRASASGKPWFVCVGALVFCAPLGAPAFTEGKACKELGEGVVKFLAGENHPDMVFVYDKDDRVLYSYNKKAEPSSRYHQARSTLTHPLSSEAELAKCPSAKECIHRYAEELKRRAVEVGYTLTNKDEDEETFRRDLGVARNIDDGKITKEEAVRRRNFYAAVSPLEVSLLKVIAEGKCPTVADCVAAYTEEFRSRAAGLNYPLIPQDEE